MKKAYSRARLGRSRNDGIHPESVRKFVCLIGMAKRIAALQPKRKVRLKMEQLRQAYKAMQESPYGERYGGYR